MRMSITDIEKALSVRPDALERFRSELQAASYPDGKRKVLRNWSAAANLLDVGRRGSHEMVAAALAQLTLHGVPDVDSPEDLAQEKEWRDIMVNFAAKVMPAFEAGNVAFTTAAMDSLFFQQGPEEAHPLRPH